jgi:hypothetical protein
MNNTAHFKNWFWQTLREAAWAPLCVVGLYGIAVISRLYRLYPNLDIPTHILGGMAIAYFYRVAIRNSQAAQTA